ncbi:MAG: hypothetical protein IPP19_09480 [Verrucomicrobia bacterium]|nr:hypothetical protein [Verrucomicrobiota bacterium]
MNKAALKITANHASKIYGAANPTFTASYSGFVNADTASVVSGLQISSAATVTSAAGTTSPIIPSGATAANYTITYALNGAVDASTLGNGATLDRHYSEITGRLDSITSGRGYSADVQSIIYTYDSLGNATRRIDSTTGRDESFQYDGLNRLTSSSASGGSTPSSTISVTYDALGNIKTKTNAGTYAYGENGYGPHAVTTVSGGPLGTRSFTYDANGNLAWDGQRSITWTSYNQVKSITKSGRKTEFWFGAGHERVVQQDAGGAKTTYVGSLLEVVQTGTLTEKKHYIYTPAGRVAVRTARSDSTFQTRFLHQDALGSVTTVTDEYGRVEQRFAFDAWGARTQTANTRTTSGGAVTRGFTDHEHLDDFGVIHMNGRVYDPLLGRFLSADPYIQAPGDSQSYNRYSYCINNPVNLTDPSGYNFMDKVCDAIPMIIVVVVAVVVTYATAGAGAGACGSFWATAAGTPGIGACMAGGFAGAFTGSLLNGQSVGAAFRSGLIGAASAAITYGIGQCFDGIKTGDFQYGKAANGAARALSHGMSQGMLTEMQGGQFRHGFYAGFFSSAAGPLVGKITLGNASLTYCGQLATAAVIGGAVSAIGGGKFENGAISGAFVYMFNQAMEEYEIEKLKGKGFALYDSYGRRTATALGGYDQECIASEYANGSADVAFNLSDPQHCGPNFAASQIPKGTKVLWLVSHGSTEGVPCWGNSVMSADSSFWDLVRDRLDPGAVIIMTGCHSAGADFRIANLQIIADKTHTTIYASPYNVGVARDSGGRAVRLTNDQESGNAKFIKIAPQ